MIIKNPEKDNAKLAALLKSKAPGGSAAVAAPAPRLTKTGNPSSAKYMRLNLSFYRSDADRIRDIIITAAKTGVTLNSSQALRFAIRHCNLNGATEADFIAIQNEDGRRRHAL